MLEKSFLRAEESYLTPPEYDDEKICECCGIKIPKGDVYFENDFYLLCDFLANTMVMSNMGTLYNLLVYRSLIVRDTYN